MSNTEALKIARDALELASEIADRVPTRWHELNPSNSPAEHDIGCMVNAQPDGQHGYRLILDALSAVCSALAQPQPSAPSVEPAECPCCGGAGTVRAMTNGRGPDDYEYDAECVACGGTGSADLADVINALPYSLHRVRAGVEVVDKAAVLAVIKARAPTAQPSVEPASLRQCALWVVDAYNSTRPDYLLRSIQKLTRALDGTAPTAQPAPSVKDSLTVQTAPTVPEWRTIETAPTEGQVLVAVEFDGPGDWRIKTGYFSRLCGITRGSDHHE